MHPNGACWLPALEVPSPLAFRPLEVGFMEPHSVGTPGARGSAPAGACLEQQKLLSELLSCILWRGNPLRGENYALP